jgi:hypothetical protein
MDTGNESNTSKNYSFYDIHKKFSKVYVEHLGYIVQFPNVRILSWKGNIFPNRHYKFYQGFLSTSDKMDM